MTGVNRRQLGGGLIGGGLLGAGLATQPVSAAALAERPMIGAWRLEDAATILPDGRRTDLDGRKGPYDGLIIYTEAGMMAVQIASRRARLDPATPFDRVPADQRLAFLDTYEAYFGHYTVDLKAGIVRHHCEASLDPTGPGLVYERFFRIAGDLLTIRTGADANIAHDGHYNLLHWRRVKA